MTYTELKTALKPFKAKGLTDIKLNASKTDLENEYKRVLLKQAELQGLVNTTPTTKAEGEPSVNRTKKQKELNDLIALQTKSKENLMSQELLLDKLLGKTKGQFIHIIDLHTPVHIVDGGIQQEPRLTISPKEELPSDDMALLHSLDAVIEILTAFTPLGQLLLKDEFKRITVAIKNIAGIIEELKNNIAKEELALEAKKLILFSLKKTTTLANEFLIKPQFTLEEFKELVQTTLEDEELILVSNIQLDDLSEILEGIEKS